MSWFRMYHEFATDPKVQMLSEADQRRFVMLLCLRCCNGDVTLQDKPVAFQLRISLDEWQASKATLMEQGLIDENNAPVAWAKRQYTSDSSSERVARHREKLKQACNVSETAPEAEVDTEKEADKASKPLKKIHRPTNNHATLPEWMKAADKSDLPDEWFILVRALKVEPGEIQPRAARFLAYYTTGNGATYTSDNWGNEFWKWFSDKPKTNRK